MEDLVVDNFSEITVDLFNEKGDTNELSDPSNDSRMGINYNCDVNSATDNIDIENQKPESRDQQAEYEEIGF